MSDARQWFRVRPSYQKPAGGFLAVYCHCRCAQPNAAGRPDAVPHCWCLPGPDEREKVVGGVITCRVSLKQPAPGRRIRWTARMARRWQCPHGCLPDHTRLGDVRRHGMEPTGLGTPHRRVAVHVPGYE